MKVIGRASHDCIVPVKSESGISEREAYCNRLLIFGETKKLSAERAKLLLMTARRSARS